MTCGKLKYKHLIIWHERDEESLLQNIKPKYPIQCNQDLCQSLDGVGLFESIEHLYSMCKSNTKGDFDLGRLFSVHESISKAHFSVASQLYPARLSM